MTNAITKLRALPLWIKIALAAATAVLLGVVGFLFLGGAAGAIPGAGVGALLLRLLKGSPRDELAPALLRAEAKREDENAIRVRSEEEAAARERAAERKANGERLAREASADDGDDLSRVYERDTRPPGVD